MYCAANYMEHVMLKLTSDVCRAAGLNKIEVKS
jgi:hypothetical protein